MRQLCRLLGFGLMAVSATRDWVEVLVEPGPYQPRRDHRRRRQLLSEHARRRGDPSPGAVKLAHQQERQGIPTLAIFAASAVFVFLVLAAQCESWKLPLAIVLIVPMCLLASATGLAFRGMPIDILAQIGFVVLVGLAAKNAILIAEFARQRQDQDGDGPEEAAAAAARIRLRPILMTSFAFILGVFPLAVATGAGSEMRQSLGTAVFFGMLGVTAFGLLFTPAFYTFVRKLGSRRAV